MPTGAMSLEGIKIQREAMEKKVGDIERKLEESLKENEDLQTSNKALILSMKQVMQQAEKQEQQLAEKFKEEKTRLEEEISQLKLTVQGLSSAKQDCESISDGQEDCECTAHPQEDCECIALAQEDCESISDASRATSKVTMISTGHSRKRLAERNISRREVQEVIKHGGEGVLQANGNRRVSHNGKRVILDKDEPRVVTVHPVGPCAAAQGPSEPEDQRWVQVVKHSKQRTPQAPQMALFSNGSLKPIPISVKDDIQKFKRENESLDAQASGRLDCLRGLEARMSEADVHALLAPMAWAKNPSSVIETRVRDLLKSIAEQWKADEAEEYIRVHGIRNEPANLLRKLPEGKRERVMRVTTFFDARDKSSVLFQKIRASSSGVV